jgi:hypothetical protein
MDGYPGRSGAGRTCSGVAGAARPCSLLNRLRYRLRPACPPGGLRSRRIDHEVDGRRRSSGNLRSTSSTNGIAALLFRAGAKVSPGRSPAASVKTESGRCRCTRLGRGRPPRTSGGRCPVSTRSVPAGCPYSLTTPAVADVRASPITSNLAILCHVRPPFSVESRHGSSILQPAIQPCCEFAQLTSRMATPEPVNSRPAAIAATDATKPFKAVSFP